MENNILKQNLLKAIKKTKNTVQKKISFTNIPNIINDLSKTLKNDYSNKKIKESMKA